MKLTASLASLTLLVCGVVVSAAAYAAPAPVTGKWTVHRNIAGNEGDSICTFTQTEKVIAGDCKADGNTANLTGSIDGDKITWKYDVDYQGNTLTLTYAGVVGDASIDGTIDVQPYNVAGEFKATPIKDEAPAK